MNYYRNFIFSLNGYFNYTKQAFIKRFHSEKPLLMNENLSEKHSMVTGANSGLGFQTTIGLLRHGATVHMVCRNEEKARKAIEEIKKIINQENKEKNNEKLLNDKIKLHIADLSNIESIENFTNQFINGGNNSSNNSGNNDGINSNEKNKQPLHILVVNHGVLLGREESDGSIPKTKENFETNFATNSLGSYHLINKLIPIMKNTAEQCNEPSRVVYVSSGGMFTSRLDLTNLQNERNFSGEAAYAHAKRQMVCMMEEWSKMYPNNLITFNSCHPGWVDTPGVETSLPGFHKYFHEKLRNIEQGADTQLYLSVSDEVKGKSGGMYEDRQIVSPHLSTLYTQETQEERDELKLKLDEMIKNTLSSKL